MLTQQDRQICEKVRQAKQIKIILNSDTEEDKFILSFNAGRPTINRLTHEVAIAVQNYFRDNRTDR